MKVFAFVLLAAASAGFGFAQTQQGALLQLQHIDVTTVDISLKAMFTQEMINAIAKSSSPAAQYIAKFSQERYYMWDELAACETLAATDGADGVAHVMRCILAEADLLMAVIGYPRRADLNPSALRRTGA